MQINQDRVKKTIKGHKYIEVTKSEMIKRLKGIGLCDACCSFIPVGYLIPVLNAVYCEECFEEWQERAEYYKEDEFYEDMKTEHFLKTLKKRGKNI